MQCRNCKGGIGPKGQNGYCGKCIKKKTQSNPINKTVLTNSPKTDIQKIMEENMEPKIFQAYQTLGLEAHYVDDISQHPMWTGEHFNFEKDHWTGQAGQEFHELMHYMVATPEQRTMPDYGLGAHVEASETQTKATKTHNKKWENEDSVGRTTAQKIETMVCDLFPVMDMITGGEFDWGEAAYEFGHGEHMAQNIKCEEAVEAAWEVLQQLLPDKTKEEVINECTIAYCKWLHIDSDEHEGMLEALTAGEITPEEFMFKQHGVKASFR